MMREAKVEGIVSAGSQQGPGYGGLKPMLQPHGGILRQRRLGVNQTQCRKGVQPRVLADERKLEMCGRLASMVGCAAANPEDPACVEP